MPNIVTLSGGNHAELRPPEEISERLRRPITRALARVSAAGWAAMRVADKAQKLKDGETLNDEELAALQLSEADIVAFGDANDYGVVGLVKHWTRPEPITLDSVLDLPAPDYDALRAAVAPLVSRLIIDFGASKDSDSPTEPSSASATRSEGAEQTTSPESGGPTGSSSSD